MERIKNAATQACKIGGFEWRRFATPEELDLIAGTLYDIYVGEQKWDPAMGVADCIGSAPATQKGQLMQLIGCMRLVESDALQAGKIELGLYREDLVKDFQDGVGVECNRVCLARAGRGSSGQSKWAIRALCLATSQYALDKLGISMAFGTQDLSLAIHFNKLGLLEINRDVEPFKYNESERSDVVMVRHCRRFISNNAASRL